MTASLIEHFSALDDPRIERNKAHALIDIIVLSISAVASGANGWEGIEEFGKEKLDGLRQFVPLKQWCTLTRLHRLCFVQALAFKISRVFYELDACGSRANRRRSNCH